VNSVQLRRTTATDLCSSATFRDHDNGVLVERYRPTVINNVRYVDYVYNADDTDLKACSHRSDVNELSCQFLALNMFRTISV